MIKLLPSLCIPFLYFHFSQTISEQQSQAVKSRTIHSLSKWPQRKHFGSCLASGCNAAVGGEAPWISECWICVWVYTGMFYVMYRSFIIAIKVMNVKLFVLFFCTVFLSYIVFPYYVYTDDEHAISHDTSGENCTNYNSQWICGTCRHTDVRRCRAQGQVDYFILVLYFIFLMPEWPQLFVFTCV